MMRRKDLVKADLFSEILLLASGIAMVALLVTVAAMAWIRAITP